MSPLALTSRLSLHVRLVVLPVLAMAALSIAPAAAYGASSYNAEICGNNAVGGQMHQWSGFRGTGATVAPCFLTSPSSGTEPPGYFSNSVYTAPASEAITALYWGAGHFWSGFFGSHGWSSGLATNITNNQGTYYASVNDCSSNSAHQYNASGLNSLTNGCNSAGLSGGLSGWWSNVGLIEACNASSCADNGDSGAQLGAMTVTLWDPYTTPSIGVSGSLWSAANGGWISGLNEGSSLSMSYSAYDPGTVCNLYAYLVNSAGAGVWGSNSNAYAGWDGSGFTSGQPCSPYPTGSLTPNLASLPTGSYYLNVVAQNPGDYAGGSYGWAQGATWTQGPQLNVDNSPPTGSLSPSGNASTWYPSAQTVTVSAGDVGSGLNGVYCSGPGAPTGAITPSQLPYTIHVSQDGANTISCSAEDNTGNWASLGTTTLHIDDQQGGTVSFSGPSQNTWYASAQTVNVSAAETTTYSGIAGLECSDNDGDYVPYTGASAAVPVTGDGQHVIRCYSVTGAGLSSDPVMFRVHVDTTTPSIDFSGAPEAPAWTHGTVYLTATASNHLSADSIASIQCTVNGSTTATADGPTVSIPVTTSGATTVDCAATNAAGTPSADSSYTVQIDNAAPTIQLAGSSTSAAWASGTQSVTTSAAEAAGPSGVATTSCEQGTSGAWTTVDNAAQTFDVTASGVDTITCYATTNAGVQSTYAIYRLKVDNQAPTVALTGAPTAPQWTSSQHPITATASEAQALSGIQSVTCQVGSADPVTTSGDTAAPQLTTATNGPTDVSCYATSNTGVQGPTTTKTYDNDSNLPVVAFAGPSQQAWESSAQTLTVLASQSPTISGIQSITCQQGSGPAHTTTGATATLTVATAGTSTVSCYATNNASAEGAAQTYQVNIDAQTPTTTLSGAAGPPAWLSGPQTITATASEGSSQREIAQVSCTVDGASPQIAQAASEQVNVTGEGIHTVTCTSATAAGVQSAPATQTVQIDSGQPTVGFARGPDQDHWYQTAQTIQVTATKTTGTGASIAAIDCTIRGQNTTYANHNGGAETVTVTVAPPGGLLSCTATDTAGNISHAATWKVNIDNTAPTGAITAPAQSPLDELVAQVADSGSGVASAAFHIQSAGAWQTLPTTWDAQSGVAAAVLPASLPAGAHAVQLVAADAAGNTATLAAQSDGSPASVTIAPPTPATQLTLALAPASTRVGNAAGRTTCRLVHAVRAGKRPTKVRRACTTKPGDPNALTLTLPYGHATTLIGSLRSGGQTIAGQTLTISQQIAGRSTTTVIGHAFTSAHGDYVFSLPAGPTRTIIVSYAGSSNLLSASSRRNVAVTGSVKLSVAHKLRQGRLALSLRVAGGNMPSQGVLVRLSYRVTTNGRWLTVRRSARTNRAGRLRLPIKVPVKAMRAHRIQIEASVARQAGWPFLPTVASARHRL